MLRMWAITRSAPDFLIVGRRSMRQRRARATAQLVAQRAAAQERFGVADATQAGC